MTRRQDHWERVYESKPSDRVGWFTPHLTTSLNWISNLGLSEDSPIIDVGSGASTLVDDLLDSGFRCITALDISKQALFLARKRLGDRADAVTWLRADITAAELPDEAYALWHDRAVFHFLTEQKDRDAYRRKLMAALKPGGHVIIGAFAPEAPPKCSGLPVCRYDQEQLANQLGPGFELLKHVNELHITPGGVEQMYLYCLLRRTT